MTDPLRRLGPLLARGIRGVLAPADTAMNRLYGWRYNPLYQSGTIASALLAVVLLTGIYLLFFYRIGAPYESVTRLAEQPWTGRWIRSLHRYASDAAVVAVAVHAFRMFAQRRSWGPRALAWISGLVLLFVVLVCGWTGYVMVWDVQGLVLAREGARFLDALPLFSEPIGRSFVGEREIPSAFFFLNLFLHVALPVGIGVILWVHVARVARPLLLPPRRLMWTVIGLLLVASIVLPARLGPEADLFRTAVRAPYDWFYSFWLPLTQPLPAAVGWAALGLACAVLVAIPWWTRPGPSPDAAPSAVNERLCTGCRTCYLDCPYEAIAMVTRVDGRDGEVARVDPALCVSCGICSGSCAPMGVGPAGRTGRDQLSVVKRFAAGRPAERDMVVVACANGASRIAQLAAFERASVYPVDCVGNLHSSVVEYLLRSGVSGVLIASCPPRDCWNREGPKWLRERVYHDREAELRDRVDKRRVAVVYAGEGERVLVQSALRALAARVAALTAAPPEREIELDLECEPMPEEATP